MTREQLAVSALVDALKRSTRATPALKILAWPKYADRELRPQARPDGSILLTLKKFGYEYKHRGRKLKTPPPADTTAIQAALNTALAPGYSIQAVEDCGTYIKITLGGNKHV